MRINFINTVAKNSNMNRNYPCRHPVRGPTIFDHLGHASFARAPPRAQDDRTISMSAARLNKWKAQLESIEDVRNAIKSLSMSKDEKIKLLGLTTQLKSIVGEVKQEMREKLWR
jgi:hypothetical protein